MTPPSRNIPRRRGGFSLVELLVVILVIIILVSITVAVVGKARRAGNTARIKSDLIAISTAIDQFKADHKGLPGMVPNVPPNVPTYNALAYSLVAPADQATDGAHGPGFRVQLPPNGSPQPAPVKLWPAYLDASKFKVVMTTLPDNTTRWDLLDAFDMPIVYLPRRKPNVRPNLGILANYGSSTGSFDAKDVDGILTTPPLTADGRKGLLIALGDRNANNKIDAGETMNFSGDYVLMSAGFDAEFFVGDTPEAFQKSDDVYNFDR